MQCFNDIIIDKNGTLTKGFNLISTKKQIRIRGNNSTIKIINESEYIESILDFYNIDDLSISDIIFDYDNKVVHTPESSDYVKCIKVRGTYTSTIIKNICIKNYGSIAANIGMSNFIGIEALSLKGSSLILQGIVIENLTVCGNGVYASGYGGCYGILVKDSIWNQEQGDVHYGTGVGTIRDCSFMNICNVNEAGSRINDDASGIYIQCGYGVSGGTNCEIEINNCHFHNCEKRGLKIQADSIVIKNIYSSFDWNGFYGDQLIDIQGSNAYISGVFGVYGGPIFKFNHGNNGVVENVNIESLTTEESQPAITCTYNNLLLNNCNIKTGAALFYHNTESGIEYNDGGVIVNNSKMNCPKIKRTESSSPNVLLSINSSQLNTNQLGTMCKIDNCIINPYDNTKVAAITDFGSSVVLLNSTITLGNIGYVGSNFSRVFDIANYLLIKNCEIKSVAALTIYAFIFIRESLKNIEIENLKLTNITCEENYLRFRGALSEADSTIKIKDTSIGHYLNARKSLGNIILDNVTNFSTVVFNDSDTVRLKAVVKNCALPSSLISFLKKGSSTFVVTSRPAYVDANDAGFEILFNNGATIKPNYWNGIAWVDATGATV